MHSVPPLELERSFAGRRPQAQRESQAQGLPKVEGTETGGLPNTTDVRWSALIRVAHTSTSAGRGTDDILPHLSACVHYSPGVPGFDGVALEVDLAGHVESRRRTALHVDRPTVRPLFDIKESRRKRTKHIKKTKT